MNLLAYGSLMHPAELALHTTRPASGALVPVRVRGFRRSFCQRPSWRRGPGNECGVLTVRQSPDAWFNAVLVTHCDDALLARLDHRERGYRRVAVEVGDVARYDDVVPILPAPAGTAEVDAGPDVQLYVGRDELYDPELRPNCDYLRLCAEAAARWGDDFLDDFLDTTWVAGQPLRSVLVPAGDDVSDSPP